MKFAGRHNWKVSSVNGITKVFTIEELDSLYVNSQPRRRVRDYDKMAEFWNFIVGPCEVVDTSLNAEVPASVVEFFDNRRVELAA